MFLNIFAINVFSCGLTICQINPCFCLKWNQICRIQDSHSINNNLPLLQKLVVIIV